MRKRMGWDGKDQLITELLGCFFLNESVLMRVDCVRLLGFFVGSTLTGASVYYYVLDEYKVSNELLTEDIYVSSALNS